jgi:hypothetical protein
MPESLFLYQAVTIDDAIIDSLRRQYLATGKSFMHYPTIRLNILGNYTIKYPVTDIDVTLKAALNRLCHARGSKIQRDCSSSYKLCSSEEENSSHWNLCADAKVLKPVKASQSPGFITKKYNDQRGAYTQERERQEAAALNKKAKAGHFIYYIQWENDQQFVKIGYSTQPAQRIASFLTGNPNKLILLRMESVESKCDELSRHNYFAKYHYEREWFYYQGELREYIQEIDCNLAINTVDQISSLAQARIIVEYF